MSSSRKAKITMRKSDDGRRQAERETERGGRDINEISTCMCDGY